MFCADFGFSHKRRCRPADIIVGKNGHMRCRHTQLRQRRRHIRLSAAESNFQVFGLCEAAVTRGGEAHHNFAESDGVWHVFDWIMNKEGK